MRQWFILDLGTVNTGRWTKGEVFDVAELVDALALQEVGNNPEIIQHLRFRGFGICDGHNLPGQSSTVLAYDKSRLKLIEEREFLLSPRTYGGKGAGPSMVKTKWLIGGMFRDRESGRFLLILCVHFVASQQFPLRKRIAAAMVSRVLLVGLRFKCGIFVMGDWNAIGKRVINWLGARWTTTDAEGEDLDTHGHRNIDLIAWVKRWWIEFVDHRVVESKQGDHLAKVARFRVKRRRRPSGSRTPAGG